MSSQNTDAISELAASTNNTRKDPETASLAATTTTTSTLVAEDYNNNTSQASAKSSKGSHRVTSTQTEDRSWLDKLKPSKPEEPGKEKWRDANLSEKERWKEWQKAKDREQKKNSTAGYLTEHYKGKGKTGYWLDAFF